MNPIVLFEDEKFTNFLPVVYFRPVWEVICGARMLIEKIEKLIGTRVYFSARDHLQRYYLSPDRNWQNLPADQEILAINSRWIANREELRNIRMLKSGEALYSNDNLVAVKVPIKKFAEWVEGGVLQTGKISGDISRISTPVTLLNFIWDAIEFNGKEIEKDFRNFVQRPTQSGEIFKGVHLIHPEQIHIEKGTVIKPGVVIDATDGPVWIEENVHIMANAVLLGPLFIGRGSTIKVAAKIYENTTIGPVCKIGGEVEESIIQGYSNKQHEGFLGHSYLGSWVNLGADTNNSDLKNNYGNITVFLNGKPIQTGKMFLGLIMGDHSKTAINTMFNTGTIVGVNCNIFGSGMPPKFVPSFSWGGSEGFQEYRLDKALEVARKMMERRHQPFSDHYRKLFEEVYEQTKRMEERI